MSSSEGRCGQSEEYELFAGIDSSTKTLEDDRASVTPVEGSAWWASRNFACVAPEPDFFARFSDLTRADIDAVTHHADRALTRKTLGELLDDVDLRIESLARRAPLMRPSSETSSTEHNRITLCTA